MKLRKVAAALLIVTTGAISVALTGCKHCGLQSVRAATNSGPVSIHHMGGDINVSDAPNGADLATMGGNIHLSNVGSQAKVKTMGGDIAIDHANASIDASTMGGKITIADANGAIKASTMGGDIKARMVGSSEGRRDVDLSSMEVKITLAYTKKAGDHFRIIDHVGLTQRESDEWDSSFGTPRKYIRATGRVGSGLNHVTIDTVNGDVILKQE